MIYELLTSKGKLSPNHKKELIEKRGFTEDIITEYRFFSGGKYLLEFEDEFVRNYDETSLISSGIFNKPDRSDKILMAPQLLENRIIIPYLNEKGQAYFVRPHKFGLEVPIQIYHEKISVKKDSFAILTESEFKAVAGNALGFKTIGIPGISSFSDIHFKRLVTFIQKIEVKKICILYDNEIKDNPSFPNYKEEAFKRYDTEYFSYLMAKNLLREGIDCRIGKLPDSWRINGKIDLDGSLAQKKTTEDIRTIIDESKNPRAYVQDLTQEAQNILNQKLAKKRHRTHISVDWGKYIATRQQGKQTWDEIISNFTLKIIARHETMEGVVREVILIDEFGKHSRSFAIPSSPMVQSNIFADFVMNKGNYIWRGTNDDLVNIWQGLFLEDDGRYIVEPDHIGWFQEEKIWLFGNIAIQENGEILHPDKHNIFWREKYGLKPIPIAITTGKTQINEGIPIISKTKIDLADLSVHFSQTIGESEAQILLGWIGAVLFMEEIFSSYNCFPFLFFAGRRGSGKSTVAEWVMNCFGIESGGKQAADSTAVYLQRVLSYYSSLPVYIDEYRNSRQVVAKNGFLRNVYNRQSAGKGIKSSFGVREGRIRGTLLIVGEETPDDNALLTRCIVLHIIEKNRLVNHFNWFQTHRSALSYLTCHLLQNKAKLKEEFTLNLEEGKNLFVKRGLDDRMAINYATVGAGYCALFGTIPASFQNYLMEESQKVKKEYDKEHAMQVFWDDLLALQSSGKLRQEMWDSCSDPKLIYIYFHGLYSIWASEYRLIHGIEPFKSGAIRKYMEEEPGFFAFDQVKKIGRHPRRCVVFLREKAPIELLELIETSCIPN